jgi:hypothetical protein
MLVERPPIVQHQLRHAVTDGHVLRRLLDVRDAARSLLGVPSLARPPHSDRRIRAPRHEPLS